MWSLSDKIINLSKQSKRSVLDMKCLLKPPKLTCMRGRGLETLLWRFLKQYQICSMGTQDIVWIIVFCSLTLSCAKDTTHIFYQNSIALRLCMDTFQNLNLCLHIALVTKLDKICDSIEAPTTIGPPLITFA